MIEADVAMGQPRYGRATSDVATPQVWITASAFHIPLRDDSVDGMVCVRLSHHLPTAAEQDRLIHELLRKPPKPTMTVDQVAELARANGARLVYAPPLSHRFRTPLCAAGQGRRRLWRPAPTEFLMTG